MSEGTQTTTTTTTQRWLLEKYSRSRSLAEGGPPAKKRRIGEVAGQASDEHIEWDHYSQPQLALRLETTFAQAPSGSSSSSGGTYYPVRMILSVTFDPLYRDARSFTQTGGQGQQPLTLDSLDLTSFSSPSIRAATPADQLPLKAVYRDAVMGLRYISLLPPSQDASSSSTQRSAGIEFKRLQVKFTSTEERVRFIEAVKTIVPAKPAVESSSNGAVAGASPAPRPVDGAPRTTTTAQAPEPRQKKKKAGKSTQVTPVPATPTRPLPSQVPSSRPPDRADIPSGARSNNVPPGARQAGPVTPARQAPREPTASASASTSRLPATLATILPNLSTPTQAPQAAPASPAYKTASLALAALPPEEFEQLLQDALMEDGFEGLVARVKDVLTG
ncbi:hypothetical protein JCM10049v2_005654 [Rhodotorula toruloides]